MIYLLMKGDIDQCKGEDTITFQTQINLDIGLFTRQSLFYYCDKHLVTIVEPQDWLPVTTQKLGVPIEDDATKTTFRTSTSISDYLRRVTWQGIPVRKKSLRFCI